MLSAATEQRRVSVSPGERSGGEEDEAVTLRD